MLRTAAETIQPRDNGAPARDFTYLAVLVCI